MNDKWLRFLKSSPFKSIDYDKVPLNKSEIIACVLYYQEVEVRH